MKLSVSFRPSPIIISALAFVLATAPASARNRERVWDQTPACPTDSTVLVGAQGSASRFTALSGCPDVQVIPEADPASLADHQPGSYVVRETPRDEDGRLDSNYYSAELRDSAGQPSRKGDVKVIQDYSAGGVPSVTIAAVEDESASAPQPAPPQRAAHQPRPQRTPVPVPATEPAPLLTAPVNVASIPAPRPAVRSLDERLLDLRADRATPFDREIAEVARRQRVDPLLLHAVIKRESAYRATVVSRAGAIGAMQMMPGTGRMLGLSPSHLRNPRANIEAGARLLRRLADRYKGNFQLVLAAYNAGEGAVRKYGNRIPPYAETQHYVRAVLQEYGRLAARAGLTLAGTR